MEANLEKNTHVRIIAQSCLTLCAPQAPLSMGFSRQEYWSGLPFPSRGYLPNPGVKPRSPALQVDSLPSQTSGKPTRDYIASCESSQNKRFVCMLRYFHCVWPFATLWTVACQAPLPMGFSRQEYWSGLSCSSPGDLPDPGIKPVAPTAPALQAESLPPSHWGCPPCDSTIISR